MNTLILTLAVVIQGMSHGGQETLDAKGQKAGHAVPEMATAEAAKVKGMLAPDFTTTSTDGKTVRLKDLRRKPTILVFIERDCPCCKSGRPYMDRVQQRYGDVANIVGLVYGSVEDAKIFKKNAGPQFPVLADPKGKIAKLYGAKASLAVRLVDKSGRIAASYPGYSGPMLKELTATVAKLAGIKDRNMPTLPAPKELTMGCMLGMREAMEKK